eukprot:2910341-Amphidinium_carterae.1
MLCVSDAGVQDLLVGESCADQCPGVADYLVAVTSPALDRQVRWCPAHPPTCCAQSIVALVCVYQF